MEPLLSIAGVAVNGDTPLSLKTKLAVCVFLFVIMPNPVLVGDEVLFVS